MKTDEELMAIAKQALEDGKSGVKSTGEIRAALKELPREELERLHQLAQNQSGISDEVIAQNGWLKDRYMEVRHTELEVHEATGLAEEPLGMLLKMIGFDASDDNDFYRLKEDKSGGSEIFVLGVTIGMALMRNILETEEAGDVDGE